MEQIYLDYNASTPLDSEVVSAMLPYLTEHYGNPSTNHFAAIGAKKAIEHARKQVSSLIHAKTAEIIFTSGGSESNNYVIKNVFETFQSKGNHIISSRIEHPAILKPLAFLEKKGVDVTYVGVDEYGQVSVEEIEKAIRPETILISIMHANNEVGTLQPIKEIGKLAKKHNILFHTDAAQSVGKVPIDVEELQVDFLSIAGHKLYAPKGVGALYIRDGIDIGSFIHGAGHEQGRRAGTENVLLIVGLGQACELCEQKQAENERIKELCRYFWKQLQETFPNCVNLNGHPEERLPNTLNVSFRSYIGQEILEQMPDVAASTGSACHSGVVTLSPVLQAMGVTAEEGKGTIRFSLGRMTTQEQINQVIARLKRIL
ncbi:cysteine desulfurase family protein [Halalkalibacter urbisdiaboli]|uniref:cysteine desulfurase family protein n=1 Tax=Halalkalibacter urbisdiaboli TaxID=1960589 RepID=UPI000B43097B|nr:cysteine desulfurase family protein [Halalkalibacter urbisdiaboli]